MIAIITIIIIITTMIIIMLPHVCTTHQLNLLICIIICSNYCCNSCSPFIVILFIVYYCCKCSQSSCFFIKAVANILLSSRNVGECNWIKIASTQCHQILLRNDVSTLSAKKLQKLVANACCFTLCSSRADYFITCWLFLIYRWYS